MPDIESTVSDVEAAIEKLSAEAEPVEAAPEPEPVEQEAAPEETPEPAEATSEKNRDEHGRFAKKTAAAQGTEANGAKPTSAARAKASGQDVPGGTPAAISSPEAEPTFKPPQSWTPAEREALRKAPPEIQKAVERREREIQTGLQESAPAKRFQQELTDAAAPYAAHLQATGVSLPAAVQNYGQMHYAVHQGAPQQVGALVGNMVMARGNPEHAAQAMAHAIQMAEKSGVTLEHINRYLGNAPAAQQQPPVDINAAVRQQIQAMAQQAQQAKRQQEMQEVASKEEFWGDIQDTVTKLVNSGMAPDLKSAVDLAKRMNPEISAILQQRAAAKSAQSAQATNARAKAAGSSIRSSPAGGHLNGGGPRSTIDDVNDAIERLTGR